MDIGTQLKNARKDAHMTQEDAAEYLDVSRQSISNWENSKTYPDIMSVVKLSDLYNISLDSLLKEKEGDDMSDYVKYLNEGTKTLKNKNRYTQIGLVLSYLFVWLLGLFNYWSLKGNNGVDNSAYFGVLLPIMTLIVSIACGYYDYFKKKKYYISIL